MLEYYPLDSILSNANSPVCVYQELYRIKVSQQVDQQTEGLVVAVTRQLSSTQSLFLSGSQTVLSLASSNEFSLRHSTKY